MVFVGVFSKVGVVVVVSGGVDVDVAFIVVAFIDVAFVDVAFVVVVADVVFIVIVAVDVFKGVGVFVVVFVAVNTVGAGEELAEGGESGGEEEERDWGEVLGEGVFNGEKRDTIPSGVLENSLGPAWWRGRDLDMKDTSKPVHSRTNCEQADRSREPRSRRCPSKRFVATFTYLSVNNVFACIIWLSATWQIHAIMDPSGFFLLSDRARE